MSALKSLSDFFTAIANDPRISITHIGLYAALLQYWQEHHFDNPVNVFSYEIMTIAKISASTVYSGETEPPIPLKVSHPGKSVF